MSALLQDPSVASALPALAFLLAARLVPLVLLFPVFLGGVAAVPLTARVAVLGLLVTCLLPSALGAAAPVGAASLSTLLILSVRELVLGLSYAFALALPLHAASWAGELIEGLRDAMPPRHSPLGRFQLWLGIAIFIAVGGHRLTLLALGDSLRFAPLAASTTTTSVTALALGSAQLLGHALLTALVLAAPALLAVALAELSAGLLARVAGAPYALGVESAARPLLVLLVVLLSLVALISGLEQSLGEGLRHLSQSIR